MLKKNIRFLYDNDDIAPFYPQNLLDNLKNETIYQDFNPGGENTGFIIILCAFVLAIIFWGKAFFASARDVCCFAMVVMLLFGAGIIYSIVNYVKNMEASGDLKLAEKLQAVAERLNNG